MTTATLSTTIQERIQNICDVNSTWVEELGKAGVLDLLDMEMEFEGGGFAEVLAEDYDISIEEAARELDEFVRTNRRWDTATLVRHMEFAFNYVQEFGYDGEDAIDAIVSYSEREEAVEVIDALADVLVSNPDDELWEAYLARTAA